MGQVWEESNRSHSQRARMRFVHFQSSSDIAGKGCTVGVSTHKTDAEMRLQDSCILPGGQVLPRNREDQMPRRVSKHDIVTHTAAVGLNLAAPSFGLCLRA